MWHLSQAFKDERWEEKKVRISHVMWQEASKNIQKSEQRPVLLEPKRRGICWTRWSNRQDQEQGCEDSL